MSVIEKLKQASAELPEYKGPWKRMGQQPTEIGYIVTESYIPTVAWAGIVAAKRLINEAIGELSDETKSKSPPNCN